MTIAIIAAWARAFALTQLLELPIYRFGYRASLPTSFAASAITHPIVWFVIFGPFYPFDRLDYLPRVVTAELFAWWGEAAFLFAVTRRPRALSWSLFANGASLATGLLLRATLGLP